MDRTSHSHSFLLQKAFSEPIHHMLSIDKLGNVTSTPPQQQFQSNHVAKNVLVSVVCLSFPKH